MFCLYYYPHCQQPYIYIYIYICVLIVIHLCVIFKIPLTLLFPVPVALEYLAMVSKQVRYLNNRCVQPLISKAHLRTGCYKHNSPPKTQEPDGMCIEYVCEVGGEGGGGGQYTVLRKITTQLSHGFMANIKRGN